MPRPSLMSPLKIKVVVDPFKNPQLYRASGKEMVHRLIDLWACNHMNISLTSAADVARSQLRRQNI